ncbi:MAG: RyR domain-containing protein, partial [Candidatus Cryptobacteroides sp.]
MKTYIPKPIDLSDVELTEDLNDLREAIAENAHEIWALNRQSQGWTYGPERNDALKQTPDMVPYSQLPDSEKHYDREMAMNTIKLLEKLGYDLIKREDTELHQALKKRIRNSA